jgi:vacuolar-type H+-ATPase subunit H
VACRLHILARMTGDAHARSPSALATLVAAEATLDRELDAARTQAAALVEAARHRAATTDAAVAQDIARQKAQITATLATELAAQRTSIAEAARAECARYDAVRGEPLVAIAHALAVRLAALARGEAASP